MLTELSERVAKATGLTKAQKALVRVYLLGGPQLTLRTAERLGIVAELKICRRAGFYESAGYETSLKAEDWLSSDAGRALLTALSKGASD